MWPCTQSNDRRGVGRNSTPKQIYPNLQLWLPLTLLFNDPSRVIDPERNRRWISEGRWILGVFLATYAAQLSVSTEAGRSAQGRGGHSSCSSASILLNLFTKPLQRIWEHILPCHEKSFHVAAQPRLEIQSVVCSYIFLWGALTSHNLHHSDLLRMERSRITQPAITWSRHATHSQSQYRCQQRKRQREANKFLLHNHCTIKYVLKNWSCPSTGLWQTGTCCTVESKSVIKQAARPDDKFGDCAEQISAGDHRQMSNVEKRQHIPSHIPETKQQVWSAVEMCSEMGRFWWYH